MNFDLYDVPVKNLIDEILSVRDLDNSLFEQWDDTFDNKILYLARYIKNLEEEYNAVKAASNEMLERARRIASVLDDAEYFVTRKIKDSGLAEPMRYREFVVRLQKNPPTVVISNPDLIPDSYKVVKETISFDKKALKKDIEEGFEVDGVTVEQKLRLVIK